MVKLTISKAMDGYLFAAQARRLSRHTIAVYQVAFRKFVDFFGEDFPLEQVGTRADQAVRGESQSGSKKTLLNYHISLSAL